MARLRRHARVARELAPRRAGVGRIAWVDAAKALAVVLVVAYHCSGWLFLIAFPDGGDAVAEAVRHMGTVLLPVRIPLFFVVSGLLAASAVRRSWRGLARTRLIDLLWPFLLWSLFITPLWMLRLGAVRPDPPSLGERGWLIAGSLVFGGAHYWFLPTLALFLVLGKLLNRMRVAALLGAAVLAFGLAPLIAPWLAGHVPALLGVNVARWMELLFWFLLGCFGRSLLFRLASAPVIAAAVGGVAFVAVQLVEGSAVDRLAVLASASGVTALIGVCSLAVRVPAVRRITHYLATRTLAIYLGHQLLLEIFAVALRALREAAPAAQPPPIVGALFIPVLTVALVLASTALYDMTAHGRFAWLYRPPAAWKLPVSSSPL